MSRRKPSRVVVHAPHLLPKPKAAAAVAAPLPMRKKSSPVTKLTRAKRALVAWAMSGFAMASREDRRARDKICAQCPYWSSSGNFFLGECQHADCGCTKAKTALANERCPDGRWGPVAGHKK